jgi:alpha-beta hydrolase superfamily lysophospholipase
MEPSLLSRNPTPRWKRALLILAILLGVLFIAGRIAARHLMETLALTTGPNGPETPATVGIPFARPSIPSGPRHLDSYVVTAESACVDPPVILIYHGVGETISEWINAQRFLYQHCVSSVIYDPTGSGNSSRPARFEFEAEDSIAAYTFAVHNFPARRLYVLGHSMGNGPMLESVPRMSPQPAGVIVASAFASLRSQPRTRGNPLYRALSYTIPDWWNNVEAVAAIHVPVLVVHSDVDRVNPTSGGLQIYAAANQPKTLSLLHGFSHNALYKEPSEDWWSPVLAFVHAPARVPTAGPANPR